MPSDTSEQVAADYSATAETPVEGTNALGEAEGVEEFNPPTAEPGAAVSRNWADLSEDILASVLTTGDQQPAEAKQSQGLPTEVKAEFQEAQSASGVPVAGVLSVEVAGNPAKEEVAADITFSEVSGLEGDNNSLGHIKQEEDQQPLHPSSTEIASEAADQLEGTETSHLGEDVVVAAGIKAEVDPKSPQADTTEAVTSVQPETQDSGLSVEPVAVGSQEASEPACASAKPEVSNPKAESTEPGVADTSVVATSNKQLDTSVFVAPPTSPNLVAPGVEPIRTGHSPSAPSAGPKQRTRQRSSRGGQNTRNQEATRAWFSDLDTFRDWLYQNTGGRSGRGFWLSRYLLDGVDIDQKWQVANHQAIADYLTVTQCLVLTFKLWPEYENWALANGLDRRRGIGHGRNAVEKGVLPPKRIINLNIFG